MDKLRFEELICLFQGFQLEIEISVYASIKLNFKCIDYNFHGHNMLDSQA